MRYTFSDEDEDASDAASTRRSTRNSGVNTPAEPSGPKFTASGRQVKARARGLYGETQLSGQTTDSVAPAAGGPESAIDGQEEPIANGRSRRSGLRKEVNGRPKGGNHISGYNSVDEMESESSEGEWDGGEDDDDDVDEPVIDDDEVDDEDMSQGDTDTDDAGRTLVVQLRYPKNGDLKPNRRLDCTGPLETKSQPSLTILPPTQATTAVGPPPLPISDMKIDSSPTIHDAIEVLPPPPKREHNVAPAYPAGPEANMTMNG